MIKSKFNSEIDYEKFSEKDTQDTYVIRVYGKGQSLEEDIFMRPNEHDFDNPFKAKVSKIIVHRNIYGKGKVHEEYGTQSVTTANMNPLDYFKNVDGQITTAQRDGENLLIKEARLKFTDYHWKARNYLQHMKSEKLQKPA